MKKFFLFLSLVCHLNVAIALEIPKKTKYAFKSEPIDVVITASDRDLETLNLCIEGIKSNCGQLRKIIVVSEEPLTDQAEWFDRNLFPFTRYDVAFFLNNQDELQTQEFLTNFPIETDYYYHQLMQLYASNTIQGISSNILVMDPDIVFLNKVEFLNNDLAGLYAPTTKIAGQYLKHAEALIPGFKPYFFTYSGKTHHMLMQRCILEDMFNLTEKHHKMSFWKAFCLSVAPNEVQSCAASAHELYFNYAFSKTSQVKIRRLKGFNVYSLTAIGPLKKHGHDYLICPLTTRIWLSKLIDKSKSESSSEVNGSTGTTFLIIPENQSVQKLYLDSDPEPNPQ